MKKKFSDNTYEFNTDMDTGFFNIAYIVDKNIKIQNKVWFTLSKSNSGSKINMDLLINKMLKKLLVVELKEIMENYYDLLDLNDLCKKSISYIKSVIKSFKSILSNGIVRYVYVLYPFIKVSNITGTFITTYFIYVKYFDGTGEFWVTEHIPNYEEITKDISSSINYIDNCIDMVRDSTFIYSEIYKYYIEHENTKPCLCRNYIIELFIKINFEIDIKSLSSNLSITTLGDVAPSNTVKSRKSLFRDQDILVIGFNNKVHRHYYKIMQKQLTELFYFTVVMSIYNKYINLIYNDNRDKKTMIRVKKYAKFLSEIIKKEKMNMDSDIYTLINENKDFNRKELFSCIGILIGSATKEIFNLP